MTSFLLFGGSGQIGYELSRTLAPLGEVTVPRSADVDLGLPDVVRDAVRRVRPDVVVNAAGFTAVDKAESAPEACAVLNTRAPLVLAEECRALGACLVHFSTDYVFDGAKGAPYVETDETNPLSVYGRSKRDGERAIEEVSGQYLIFRTSWVYAARGHNFPLTMRRLAREGRELAVVNDQLGAPTSASAIARGVARVLAAPPAEPGIYHMSAGGATTWYEFAKVILPGHPIRPITTAEYWTAARRPAYSVLDNGKLASRLGVTLPSWEDQWTEVSREL